jgi:hypothetical protein
VPIRLSRRGLLTAGALSLLGPQAVAYAGFRLVRRVAGAPQSPAVITLPDGYTLQNSTPSRGEYLAFVRGERNDAGIAVSVTWPGQFVEHVIAGERHLPFDRERSDPFTVTFTLPIWRASVTADSPTVQVWSYLSNPAGTGLYWHIEHNDPDRAAGYWATAAWPAVEAQTVITYMVASKAILDDAGLVERARQRNHFFALMGFETNNPLHQDNPPHWHLAYYPGPTMSAAKATVPHFWIDNQGRTFYNGQDVQGSGRTPYRVDQPAPILDASGGVILTTTIRAGGGLDLDPPDGPRYSMLPPEAGIVRVLRDGADWRLVAATDDVREGLTVTEATGPDGFHELRQYRYDPLTGPLAG